jgi:hypothetical protein
VVRQIERHQAMALHREPTHPIGRDVVFQHERAQRVHRGLLQVAAGVRLDRDAFRDVIPRIAELADAVLRGSISSLMPRLVEPA